MLASDSIRLAKELKEESKKINTITHELKLSCMDAEDAESVARAMYTECTAQFANIAMYLDQLVVSKRREKDASVRRRASDQSGQAPGRDQAGLTASASSVASSDAAASASSGNANSGAGEGSTPATASAAAAAGSVPSAVGASAAGSQAGTGAGPPGAGGPGSAESESADGAAAAGSSGPLAAQGAGAGEAGSADGAAGSAPRSAGSAAAPEFDDIGDEGLAYSPSSITDTYLRRDPTSGRLLSGLSGSSLGQTSSDLRGAER